MIVRFAKPDELLDLRRIFDAAVLETGNLEDRVIAGDVVMAVTAQSEPNDGVILGAAVLEPRDEGAHVSAIAVRRRRQNQGIGSALIDRALERDGHLTVCFDENVRPFYESLDFEIEPIEDGRYRGYRSLD